MVPPIYPELTVLKDVAYYRNDDQFTWGMVVFINSH